MHQKLDVARLVSCTSVFINRWIHPSVLLYRNSFIYFRSFPFIPFVPLSSFHPPLVGACGSGPPLICSQNKQPGKHHETFRGGRATFSLIHTGIPETHSSSCSQSTPITAGFNLKWACMCFICPYSKGNLDLCRKLMYCMCVCIHIRHKMCSLFLKV